MCGVFSGFCSLSSRPLFSTVYQCDWCLSYLGRGGSWLGYQVWPAISSVSILELVANSGSSRMSRAPNLHSLRATKLFTLLNLSSLTKDAVALIILLILHGFYCINFFLYICGIGQMNFFLELGLL